MSIANLQVETPMRCIADSDLKRKYLCDIYRKEGDVFLEEKNYKKAVKKYTEAIRTKYNEPDNLLCRSRCYFKMGKRSKAMFDVDLALTLDLGHPAAIQHKAELLFQAGNYELAIIYFHRGLRQQPENEVLQVGVEKAQKALDSSLPSRRLKLSAAGDLSIYLHKKGLHYGRHSNQEPLLSDRDPFTETSPERSGQQKFLNDARPKFLEGRSSLVRINRKPVISVCRSLNESSSLSEISFSTADRNLSESAIKEILGALYGDKEYLEKLHDNMLGPTKTSKDVVAMTEEGLNFLQERSLFWESLGPLPPPLPSRRQYKQHHKTSTNTTSIGSLENITGSVVAAPESLHRGPPTETDSPVPSENTGVSFEFKSYHRPVSSSMLGSSNSDFPLFGEEQNYSDVPVSEMGTWKDSDTEISAHEQRKRDISVYFTKESDFIEQCFVKRKFSECIQRAERCLQTLQSIDDTDIPDKIERISSLHSCLGNAAVAMQDFKTAEKHHLYVLQIGEQEGMQEVTSRALGNLGRMYILMKKYNKALNALSRKVPLCRVSTEVAWCFLEIGTCFIALDHYDYARDCGKKALHAAQDAKIDHYQFQSCLLLAMAEAKLKKYSESYRAFEMALDMAKIKDDQETVAAITQAMENLNKHITLMERKQARKLSQNRTGYPRRKVASMRPLISSQKLDSSYDTDKEFTDYETDYDSQDQKIPRERLVDSGTDGNQSAVASGIAHPERESEVGEEVEKPNVGEERVDEQEDLRKESVSEKGKSENDAHPESGGDAKTDVGLIADDVTVDSQMESLSLPQSSVTLESPQEVNGKDKDGGELGEIVTKEKEDSEAGQEKDSEKEIKDSSVAENGVVVADEDNVSSESKAHLLNDEGEKEKLKKVAQDKDDVTEGFSSDPVSDSSVSGVKKSEDNAKSEKKQSSELHIPLHRESGPQVHEGLGKPSPRRNLIKSTDKIVEDVAKITMIPNQQSLRFRGASLISTNPELMTSKEMLVLANQDIKVDVLPLTKGPPKATRQRRGVTIVTPIVEEDPEPEPIITSDEEDKGSGVIVKKLTRKQKIALKLKEQTERRSRFSKSREQISKTFWTRLKDTKTADVDTSFTSKDSYLNVKEGTEIEDSSTAENMETDIPALDESPIVPSNTDGKDADTLDTESALGAENTLVAEEILETEKVLEPEILETPNETDIPQDSDEDKAKKAIISKFQVVKKKSRKGKSKRSRSLNGRSSSLSESAMNSIKEHDETSEETVDESPTENDQWDDVERTLFINAMNEDEFSQQNNEDVQTRPDEANEFDDKKETFAEDAATGTRAELSTSEYAAAAEIIAAESNEEKVLNTEAEEASKDGPVEDKDTETDIQIDPNLEHGADATESANLDELKVTSISDGENGVVSPKIQKEKAAGENTHFPRSRSRSRIVSRSSRFDADRSRSAPRSNLKAIRRTSLPARSSFSSRSSRFETDTMSRSDTPRTMQGNRRILKRSSARKSYVSSGQFETEREGNAPGTPPVKDDEEANKIDTDVETHPEERTTEQQNDDLNTTDVPAGTEENLKHLDVESNELNAEVKDENIDLIAKLQNTENTLADKLNGEKESATKLVEGAEKDDSDLSSEQKEGEADAKTNGTVAACPIISQENRMELSEAGDGINDKLDYEVVIVDESTVDADVGLTYSEKDSTKEHVEEESIKKHYIAADDQIFNAKVRYGSDSEEKALAQDTTGRTSHASGGFPTEKISKEIQKEIQFSDLKLKKESGMLIRPAMPKKGGIMTTSIIREASEHNLSTSFKERPVRVTRFLLSDSTDDQSEMDGISARTKVVRKSDIEGILESDPPSITLHGKSRKFQLIVPESGTKSYSDLKRTGMSDQVDKKAEEQHQKTKTKKSPRRDASGPKSIYKPEFSLQMREKSKMGSTWAARPGLGRGKTDKDMELRRSKSEGVVGRRDSTVERVRSASTVMNVYKQKLTRQKTAYTPTAPLMNAFGTPRRAAQTPVSSRSNTHGTPRQKSQISLTSKSDRAPSITPRQRTLTSLSLKLPHSEKMIVSPRQQTLITPVLKAPYKEKLTVPPRQTALMSLAEARDVLKYKSQKPIRSVHATTLPDIGQFSSSMKQPGLDFVTSTPRRKPVKHTKTSHEATATTPRKKTEATPAPYAQTLQLLATTPRQKSQTSVKSKKHDYQMPTLSPRLKQDIAGSTSYQTSVQTPLNIQKRKTSLVEKLELYKLNKESDEDITPRTIQGIKEEKEEETFEKKQIEKLKPESKKEREKSNVSLKIVQSQAEEEEKEKEEESQEEIDQRCMVFSKPGFQASPTMKLYKKLQDIKQKESLALEDKNKLSTEGQQNLKVLRSPFKPISPARSRKDSVSPAKVKHLKTFLNYRDTAYSSATSASRSRSSSMSVSPARGPVSPARRSSYAGMSKLRRGSKIGLSTEETELQMNLDHIAKLQTENTEEFFDRLDQIKEETMKYEMDKVESHGDKDVVIPSVDATDLTEEKSASEDPEEEQDDGRSSRKSRYDEFMEEKKDFVKRNSLTRERPLSSKLVIEGQTIIRSDRPTEALSSEADTKPAGKTEDGAVKTSGEVKSKRKESLGNLYPHVVTVADHKDVEEKRKTLKSITSPRSVPKQKQNVEKTKHKEESKDAAAKQPHVKDSHYHVDVTGKTDISRHETSKQHSTTDSIPGGKKEEKLHTGPKQRRKSKHKLGVGKKKEDTERGGVVVVGSVTGEHLSKITDETEVAETKTVSEDQADLLDSKKKADVLVDGDLQLKAEERTTEYAEDQDASHRRLSDKSLGKKEEDKDLDASKEITASKENINGSISEDHAEKSSTDDSSDTTQEISKKAGLSRKTGESGDITEKSTTEDNETVTASEDKHAEVDALSHDAVGSSLTDEGTEQSISPSSEKQQDQTVTTADTVDSRSRSKHEEKTEGTETKTSQADEITATEAGEVKEERSMKEPDDKQETTDIKEEDEPVIKETETGEDKKKSPDGLKVAADQPEVKMDDSDKDESKEQKAGELDKSVSGEDDANKKNDLEENELKPEEKESSVKEEKEGIKEKKVKKKHREKTEHIPRGEDRFEKTDGRETRRWGRKEFFLIVELAISANKTSDDELVAERKEMLSSHDPSMRSRHRQHSDNARESSRGNWGKLIDLGFQSVKSLGLSESLVKSKTSPDIQLLQSSLSEGKRRRRSKRRRKRDSQSQNLLNKEGEVVDNRRTRSERGRSRKRSRHSKRDKTIADKESLNNAVSKEDSFSKSSERKQRKSRSSRRKNKDTSREKDPKSESKRADNSEPISPNGVIYYGRIFTSKESKKEKPQKEIEREISKERLRAKKNHKRERSSRDRDMSAGKEITGDKKQADEISADAQSKRSRKRSRRSKREQSIVSKEYSIASQKESDDEENVDEILTDRSIQRSIRRSKRSRKRKTSKESQESVDTDEQRNEPSSERQRERSFLKSAYSERSNFSRDKMFDSRNGILDLSSDEASVERKSRRSRHSKRLVDSENDIELASLDSSFTDRQLERRSRHSRRESSNLSLENISRLESTAEYPESIDDDIVTVVEVKQRRSRHSRRERSRASREPSIVGLVEEESTGAEEIAGKYSKASDRSPRDQEDHSALQALPDLSDTHKVEKRTRKKHRRSKHSRRRHSTVSQEDASRIGEGLDDGTIASSEVRPRKSGHSKRRQSHASREPSTDLSERKSGLVKQNSTESMGEKNSRKSRRTRRRSIKSQEDKTQTTDNEKETVTDQQTEKTSRKPRRSKRELSNVSQDDNIVSQTAGDKTEKREKKSRRSRREHSNVSKEESSRIDGTVEHPERLDDVTISVRRRKSKDSIKRRDSASMEQNTELTEQNTGLLKTDVMDSLADKEIAKKRKRRSPSHSRREKSNVSQEDVNISQTVDESHLPADEKQTDKRHRKSRRSRREHSTLSQEGTSRLDSTAEHSDGLADNIMAATDDRSKKARHSRRRRSHASREPSTDLTEQKSELVKEDTMESVVDDDADRKHRRKSRHSRREKSNISQEEITISQTVDETDLPADDSRKSHRKSRRSRREHSTLSQEGSSRLDRTVEHPEGMNETPVDTADLKDKKSRHSRRRHSQASREPSTDLTEQKPELVTIDTKESVADDDTDKMHRRRSRHSRSGLSTESVDDNVESVTQQADADLTLTDKKSERRSRRSLRSRRERSNLSVENISRLESTAECPDSLDESTMDVTDAKQRKSRHSRRRHSQASREPSTDLTEQKPELVKEEAKESVADDNADRKQSRKDRHLQEEHSDLNLKGETISQTTDNIHPPADDNQKGHRRSSHSKRKHSHASREPSTDLNEQKPQLVKDHTEESVADDDTDRKHRRRSRQSRREHSNLSLDGNTISETIDDLPVDDNIKEHRKSRHSRRRHSQASREPSIELPELVKENIMESVADDDTDRKHSRRSRQSRRERSNLSVEDISRADGSVEDGRIVNTADLKPRKSRHSRRRRSHTSREPSTDLTEQKSELVKEDTMESIADEDTRRKHSRRSRHSRREKSNISQEEITISQTVDETDLPVDDSRKSHRKSRRSRREHSTLSQEGSSRLDRTVEHPEGMNETPVDTADLKDKKSRHSRRRRSHTSREPSTDLTEQKPELVTIDTKESVADDNTDKMHRRSGLSTESFDENVESVSQQADAELLTLTDKKSERRSRRSLRSRRERSNLSVENISRLESTAECPDSLDESTMDVTDAKQKKSRHSRRRHSQASREPSTDLTEQKPELVKEEAKESVADDNADRKQSRKDRHLQEEHSDLNLEGETISQTTDNIHPPADDNQKGHRRSSHSKRKHSHASREPSTELTEQKPEVVKDHTKESVADDDTDRKHRRRSRQSRREHSNLSLDGNTISETIDDLPADDNVKELRKSRHSRRRHSQASREPSIELPELVKENTMESVADDDTDRKHSRRSRQSRREHSNLSVEDITRADGNVEHPGERTMDADDLKPRKSKHSRRRHSHASREPSTDLTEQKSEQIKENTVESVADDDPDRKDRKKSQSRREQSNVSQEESSRLDGAMEHPEDFDKSSKDATEESQMKTKDYIRRPSIVSMEPSTELTEQKTGLMTEDIMESLADKDIAKKRKRRSHSRREKSNVSEEGNFISLTVGDKDLPADDDETDKRQRKSRHSRRRSQASREPSTDLTEQKPELVKENTIESVADGDTPRKHGRRSRERSNLSQEDISRIDGNAEHPEERSMDAADIKHRKSRHSRRRHASRDPSTDLTEQKPEHVRENTIESVAEDDTDKKHSRRSRQSRREHSNLSVEDISRLGDNIEHPDGPIVDIADLKPRKSKHSKRRHSHASREPSTDLTEQKSELVKENTMESVADEDTRRKHSRRSRHSRREKSNISQEEITISQTVDETDLPADDSRKSHRKSRRSRREHSTLSQEGSSRLDGTVEHPEGVEETAVDSTDLKQRKSRHSRRRHSHASREPSTDLTEQKPELVKENTMESLADDDTDRKHRRRSRQSRREHSNLSLDGNTISETIDDLPADDNIKEHRKTRHSRRRHSHASREPSTELPELVKENTMESVADDDTDRKHSRRSRQSRRERSNLSVEDITRVDGSVEQPGERTMDADDLKPRKSTHSRRRRSHASREPSTDLPELVKENPKESVADEDTDRKHRRKSRQSRRERSSLSVEDISRADGSVEQPGERTMDADDLKPRKSTHSRRRRSHASREPSTDLPELVKENPKESVADEDTDRKHRRKSRQSRREHSNLSLDGNTISETIDDLPVDDNVKEHRKSRHSRRRHSQASREPSIELPELVKENTMESVADDDTDRKHSRRSRQSRRERSNLSVEDISRVDGGAIDAGDLKPRKSRHSRRRHSHGSRESSTDLTEQKPELVKEDTMNSIAEHRKSRHSQRERGNASLEDKTISQTIDNEAVNNATEKQTKKRKRKSRSSRRDQSKDGDEQKFIDDAAFSELIADLEGNTANDDAPRYSGRSASNKVSVDSGRKSRREHRSENLDNIPGVDCSDPKDENTTEIL